MKRNNDFNRANANYFAGAANTCNSKHRFHTRDAARVKALEVKRRYGKKQKPYQCGVCNEWHLFTKENQ